MALPKKQTLEQFRENHNRSGESVLDIAFQSQNISDDKEFARCARRAVKAEDEFLKIMNERNIEIG